MESNTCEYVFTRGASEGQTCRNPVVTSERLCIGCICRANCQEKVSEKFKNYMKNLKLIPLVGNSFFVSGEYGFVLEYDGEMHLKGMYSPDEDNDIKTREATEEEKELAMKECIKLD